MFEGGFKEFERDPFFNFGSSPFQDIALFGPNADPFPRATRPQIEQGRKHNDSKAIVPSNRSQSDRRRHSDTMALPGFTFGQHFDQMFDSMNRMMQEMSGRMQEMQQASDREDFNGHMYSHSSVYSYSNKGDKEAPEVYQAMSETRAAPGGVRETRKAVKDSRTKEEKMAVGHYIGPRGHTVERRRNTQTGTEQENHHFTGIDEAEGAKFDNEWHSRAGALASNHRRHSDRNGGRRLDNSRPARRAIADSSGGTRHKL